MRGGRGNGSSGVHNGVRMEHLGRRQLIFWDLELEGGEYERVGKFWVL